MYVMSPLHFCNVILHISSIYSRNKKQQANITSSSFCLSDMDSYRAGGYRPGIGHILDGGMSRYKKTNLSYPLDGLAGGGMLGNVFGKIRGKLGGVIKKKLGGVIKKKLQKGGRSMLSSLKKKGISKLKASAKSFGQQTKQKAIQSGKSLVAEVRAKVQQKATAQIKKIMKQSPNVLSKLRSSAVGRLNNLTSGITKKQPTAISNITPILNKRKTASSINKSLNRILRQSGKRRSRRRRRNRRRLRAGLTLQPGITRQVGVRGYDNS